MLEAFHEERRIGRVHDLRLLRRLWDYLRPQQGLAWVALAASLVTTVVVLARPLVMRWAIDHGVVVKDQVTLERGGLLLLAMLLVEQLLVFVQTYTLQVAGARAIADLRTAVFAFLHRTRLRFFDTQPIGRLVTRVTNDTDAILELFGSGVVSAVGDVLRLVGIGIILAGIDPRLASTAGVTVAPAVLLVLLLRPSLRRAFRDVRAKTARLSANMDEQVAGMTVVQAFRRQGAAEADFDAINVQYREANLRAIYFDAMQDAAIDMVMSVAIAAIVVRLGYHPASFGTLVAYNMYVLLFFEPLSALAQRFTLLQSAMAGAERIFLLLDTPDIEDGQRWSSGTATAPASGAKGAPAVLEFVHVSFGYKPDVPVLSDMSFAIPPGQHTAIVGYTGAGKSTIGSLALRLYDVQSGSVHVGGTDVRAQDRTELRRRFAVVPQDVYLFPGTLADNVAMDGEPDGHRVQDALERIGSLDLFLRRPDGLNAVVGERGSNYSAGERQLIAFARALYRDAEILLLDEATASIDSDTEARLQRALGVLLRDRTAIVIAHRLSTIRAAERILVLHRGRLAQEGTHADLLAAGGVYARLHALQAVAERSASHLVVRSQLGDSITGRASATLDASDRRPERNGDQQGPMRGR
ncbi:MAG: ABC transporter ATP-binding protein [Polyangiaceae bacterium]|nr:ABC transporter ATP-binding protein [Polyangiaceae bacterium]